LPLKVEFYTLLFPLPKIYPITSVTAFGLSHADQVEQLIAGGAGIVQLREKIASPRGFFTAASAAGAISRANDVLLIINDRVDIALAIGAPGVHLGQDDLPPEQARAILGQDAIIGFSTHTLEQARAACRLPVDYIAVGPIFPTRTKENPYNVVGLMGLMEIRNEVGGMPLVAIGGIDEHNMLSVFDAGADSVAIIGALISGGANIAGQMKKLASIVAGKV
jgi:thiamine-phosphate pyrophosphorylase